MLKPNFEKADGLGIRESIFESTKRNELKSPYGVGRYCHVGVSPTRSHLL